MDGSLPDLHRQLAGLLDGTIDLEQFQTWFAFAETAIEMHGSDADVELLDRVMNILAEYTGNHISDRQFLDALRVEMAQLEAATVETA
jgi:hypothetical protein